MNEVNRSFVEKDMAGELLGVKDPGASEESVGKVSPITRCLGNPRIKLRPLLSSRNLIRLSRG